MINVVMPKAGLTMERGTVSKWLKAEGSKVEKREYILEIENEKTVIEVESPGDGILHITAEVGEEYEVAGVLGYLAADEAEYKKLLAEGVGQKNASEAVQEQVPEKASENAAVEKAVHEMKNAVAAVKSSPIAKKLAKQAGIDLSSIIGTGPNGRIVEDDVKKFIEATKRSSTETATQTVVEEIKRVPLTPIRRAISRNLVESLQTTAQMTSSIEVDAAELLAFRAKLVTQEELIGARISMTDLFACMLVKALVKYPDANAQMINNEMIYYPHVNLNIAVATPDGLVTPVIRNAEKLTLLEMNRTMKDLTARAREKRLTPDELSGGTCTLSNGGAFSRSKSNSNIYSRSVTPILNRNQTCLLGTGAIIKKPVVIDDEIQIRPLIALDFTFDHRVLDGAAANAFLAAIAQYMANPEAILF